MIKWEEGAVNDKLAMYEYLYREASPSVAENFVAELDSKISNLTWCPQIGVAFRAGRRLVVPKVNVSVYYCERGSDVLILRILHDKQKFPE